MPLGYSFQLGCRAAGAVYLGARLASTAWVHFRDRTCLDTSRRRAALVPRYTALRAALGRTGFEILDSRASPAISERDKFPRCPKPPRRRRCSPRPVACADAAGGGSRSADGSAHPTGVASLS